MKSKHNNNQTSPTNHVPLAKRRLKTKPALTVMAILLIGNIFWFILWVWPSSTSSDDNEIVATVDGDDITKQQWIATMEKLYGKQTLQDLVNESVMEKAAAQNKIKVTDEEIDLELALMRSAQDAAGLEGLTEEQLRQKVRSQLILEKVLSKDVIIEDEQTATYYEENESLYNISTSYRTSIIVVEKKADAETVAEELANGSDFEVMARERSIDTVSASLGGDIGFITAQQETVDAAIRKAVGSLKSGETSAPIQLNSGQYAIVKLGDITEGKSFSYKDVKQHIERELAMEQLSADVAPEAFWSEFKTTWFYGEDQQ